MLKRDSEIKFGKLGDLNKQKKSDQGLDDTLDKVKYLYIYFEDWTLCRTVQLMTSYIQ